MKKYQGIVKDQMGTMDTLKTNRYDTYKEAHEAAEKLCKKTMGSRGQIDVSLFWPVIRDCEGDTIDRGDILLNGIGPECRYVVADFDSLEEVGDGSTWRAVDYLHEGEDLEQALIRIEKEVNR